MAASLWIMSFLYYILYSDASVVLDQASPLPVCPGDSITFICTVTVPEEDTPSLTWANPKCESNDYEIYSVLTGAKNEIGSVGGFTTAFIKSNDSTIVSNATLPMVTEQDEENKAIVCKQNLEEDVVNISLSDAPNTPENLTSSALSLTSVLLSWDAPPASDASCPPVNYSVTITTIGQFGDPVVMHTSDNTTNKTVHNLTRGKEYSFTVTGKDAGGRAQENNTVTTNILLDTPEEVQGLKHFYLNSKISIMWMPPLPSSRPPVTGYKITHNISGTILMNDTNHTEFAVEDVAPGIYVFTVLAFNILGDGAKESITMMLLNTTAVPSSSSSSFPSSIDDSNYTVIIVTVTGTFLLLIITVTFALLLYYFLRLEFIGCDADKNERELSVQSQIKNPPGREFTSSTNSSLAESISNRTNVNYSVFYQPKPVSS